MVLYLHRVFNANYKGSSIKHTVHNDLTLFFGKLSRKKTENLGRILTGFKYAFKIT
jgi:hypothetical protein